jgi:membrane protease YdiL (CAAX protease family)
MHNYNFLTARFRVSYYLNEFLKSSYLLIAIGIICFYHSTETLIVYFTYFGKHEVRNIPGMIFFSFYNIFWLFILPIAFNTLIRRENLKDIGIAWPKNTALTIILIIIALSLLIPFMIYFAKQNTFQSYSMGNMHVFQFAFIVTVLFPLYYVGEECFMRGFLFLGLWKRVGWHSFWITDVLFTAFHLAKPIPEVLLCIPASVIFNCLTLFTRSIVPAIIVHSIMGATLSTLVTYHLIRIL